jgi:two-component system, NtrC family, sensor kinase
MRNGRPSSAMLCAQNWTDDMLRSLSARIFALVALITLGGLSFLGWQVVHWYTVDLERATVAGGLRLSEMLQRGTRSSMLDNRKDKVYKMLRDVGGQSGIERLRLYNKNGLITFSSQATEQGERVDIESEACTRCHGAGEPIGLGERELSRIFREGEHRVLGLITPIRNEAACAGAACHATAEQQQILGVLDLQLSLETIDNTAAAYKRRLLLLIYTLMLCIASACGLFVWRFVHVPVKCLMRGTERISAGDLDYRIAPHSHSEIGLLARSFNLMAGDLKRAYDQLRDWAQTLEERVAEKTNALQRAQSQLVHNEKMASLGALAAVVAHEINNPLSGVLTYTKLVRKTMRDGPPSAERLPSIQKYLETMEMETARCGHIVKNLLEFSRQSDGGDSEANINEILERTLFLIAHKLELQGVKIETQLAADLPLIPCDPEQIQQALLAILINAVEAMPEGGGLRVHTRVGTSEENARQIEVVIADTGVGIAADVLPHLFEPFFTTKQDKKGVGLGLSVVYGIVQRHRGRIDVESEPGAGATFTIALPEENSLSDALLAGVGREVEDGQ